MFKIHSCITIYFRHKTPYEVRWDHSFFKDDRPTNKELVKFVKEQLKLSGWIVHITEPRFADSGRESDMLAEIICAEHLERKLPNQENIQDIL